MERLLTLDKLIIWTLAPVELVESDIWWHDYMERCTLDKLIIWTLDSVESVHGTIIVL